MVGTLGLKGRVATVREKSGKTKTFQDQGKVREFFKRTEVKNKEKKYRWQVMEFLTFW